MSNPERQKESFVKTFTQGYNFSAKVFGLRPLPPQVMDTLLGINTGIDLIEGFSSGKWDSFVQDVG